MGCSSSAPGRIAGAVRHPSPIANEVATVTGDHAMIDVIRELFRFLSQDPLSVEDVISRVGPVVNDPGAPMSIELQPALSGVRAANLDRYPDNGLPYALTIELAPGARVTAAALQQA